MTGELDSEFDFPVFRHPVDVNILDKFLPGCEIALKGKAWHRQKQILTTKELANLYPDRFSPSSQRRAVCLPTTLSIQSYCSHPATQPPSQAVFCEVQRLRCSPAGETRWGGRGGTHQGHIHWSRLMEAASSCKHQLDMSSINVGEKGCFTPGVGLQTTNGQMMVHGFVFHSLSTSSVDGGEDLS